MRKQRARKGAVAPRAISSALLAGQTLPLWTAELGWTGCTFPNHTAAPSPPHFTKGCFWAVRLS